MRHFLASGSVVGLRPKHGLSAEQRSCCSMKSITSAIGRHALKANGTNCGVGACLSISSRRDPRHLRVATGSRESLAGRFERLTLSHWSASSLTATFEIPAQEAALDVVRFGSYPGAVALQKDPTRWRAYIKDAIIEPAIGRDVLALGAVRRPALLRQVFAIAVGCPAQIVSLQKLQAQLQDKGAIETVAHYLALLEDAYLVAPLERFSIRADRRRAAPPKLVTLNNALLSAMHPDGPPDPSREPERFGFWVENACLAFAVNQGQRVTYWREEPWEIDAVFEGSCGDWALEVKTSRLTRRASKGSWSSIAAIQSFVAWSSRPLGMRPLPTATVSWPSAGRNFLCQALRQFPGERGCGPVHGGDTAWPKRNRRFVTRKKYGAVSPFRSLFRSRDTA
jgi:Domain of unknown function (DUF4143)